MRPCKTGIHQTRPDSVHQAARLRKWIFAFDDAALDESPWSAACCRARYEFTQHRINHSKIYAYFIPHSWGRGTTGSARRARKRLEQVRNCAWWNTMSVLVVFYSATEHGTQRSVQAGRGKDLQQYRGTNVHTSANMVTHNKVHTLLFWNLKPTSQMRIRSNRRAHIPTGDEFGKPFDSSKHRKAKSRSRVRHQDNSGTCRRYL